MKPVNFDTYQKLSLLIEAILGEYTDLKGTQIKDYYSRIHTSFYNLKIEYPDYFKRLRFDLNGHRPFSRDLDAIIQDMQMAGIVSKSNPSYDTLTINKSVAKESEEELLKDFPELVGEDIKNLAVRLSL